MTTLAPLSVIWMFDRTTDPQKWKMLVCLSHDDGWFLRINSKSHFRPCEPILAKDHSAFLDHDSYVECTLLMFDEYEVEEAIRSRGVVGQVLDQHKSSILGHLLAAPYIRNDDKDRLRALLG